MLVRLWGMLCVCDFGGLSGSLLINVKRPLYIREVQGVRRYCKFPNKGAGCGGKTRMGTLRGHLHLPVTFYRMKIGPFLPENMAKNV